jgi:hypothetical protein
MENDRMPLVGESWNEFRELGYRELQAEAKRRGVKANQSQNALVLALETRGFPEHVLPENCRTPVWSTKTVFLVQDALKPEYHEALKNKPRRPSSVAVDSTAKRLKEEFVESLSLPCQWGADWSTCQRVLGREKPATGGTTLRALGWDLWADLVKVWVQGVKGVTGGWWEYYWRDEWNVIARVLKDPIAGTKGTEGWYARPSRRPLTVVAKSGLGAALVPVGNEENIVEADEDEIAGVRESYAIAITERT